MIKEAIAGTGLAPFAVIGLIIFVGIFVGVSIWAFTRRSQQLAGWSSMPLADGHMINPSLTLAPTGIGGHDSIEIEIVITKEPETKTSCGKCENCSCHEDDEKNQ